MEWSIWSFLFLSKQKFVRLSLHVLSFSSEMSKKINVDPVLTLLESNHDFCDTKKEIKVLCSERSAIITGLIRATHCYVLNIKKSHSGFCTKEIKRKIIFCPHFVVLRRHFQELWWYIVAAEGSLYSWRWAILLTFCWHFCETAVSFVRYSQTNDIDDLLT